MRKERGFTLIELLVAMVILLITGIMFLQTFLFYIRYNLEIKSKEVAQSILADRMNTLLAVDYYQLEPGTTNKTITKEGISYTVSESIEDRTDYKDITVSVQWSLFGKNFNRTATSRRSPP